MIPITSTNKSLITVFKEEVTRPGKESLNSRLIDRGIIDKNYDCLLEVIAPRLNNIVKERLKNLFLMPITIAGIVFPLNQVLQAIFTEIKKLSFGHSFRPQLRGSKVLDVLGKEYAEDLFRSIGIELTQEELAKIKNSKKSYDLDLGIWINARYHEREEIISAVGQALFNLLRPLSTLSDNDLKKELFLEKPANILDDSNRYLNTSIGQDDFHVEILWIESFSRGEIFRKDARSINLSQEFLNNLGEPEVHSSESILKPFIDLLFDLLSVSDPDSVNKRGLGRLFLEEAQGKRLIDPSLEEKFYVTALLKCPKGKTFAKYFYELMEFTSHKHAREDLAFFILFIKMGSLLTRKIGSRDLATLTEKDTEEYKKCLPKTLQFENEIFQILYQYTLREDVKLLDVLSLISVLQERIPLEDKGFILKLKVALSVFEKIPLPDPLESPLGLKVLIALYAVIPSQDLKIKILNRLPFDISGFDLPIVGLKGDFFAKVALNDKNYPGEGYLRAFLSDSELFQVGLQRLNRFQLRSVFPWLIVAHPVNAFRLYKTFKEEWSHEDRQKALNLFVKNLPKCSEEQKLNFSYAEWAYEVEKTGLKSEALVLRDLASLIKNPIVTQVLSPYLYQDRFIEEGSLASFTDLLSYTPLDKAESYANHLSQEKLSFIFSSKEVKKSDALARLARVYLRGSIPKTHYFRLLFFFRFTAEDLSSSLYQRVTEEVAIELQSLHEKKKEIGNLLEEIAVDVASAPDCDPKLPLIMLEMKIIRSSKGVDSVMPKILSNPNAFLLRRVWTWALDSSFKETFLLKALGIASLQEEALTELQTQDLNSEYLFSLSQSLFKRKAFIPLFFFIRDHERKMKKHPDWKKHLSEVYEKWLHEKCDFTVLREGFITFIGLSTPFDDYLLHILCKLDEANHPDLRLEIIKYLLSHFTLENLHKKEALLNLLLKNLSELSCELLPKYESFLLEIACLKLTKQQEEHLMKITMSLQVASSDHPFFSLIDRFKSFPKFKEWFRDLALTSQDDSLFHEALRIGFIVGFPIGINRLQTLTRLLACNSEETFRFLTATRGWTVPELRQVFSELIRDEDHSALFEQLTETSFFNPIVNDPKNHDLIRSYIQEFDDWALIVFATSPFFKNYFDRKEGYQLLVDRLKHAYDTKNVLLLEQWTTVDWNENEALFLFEALFRNPQASLRRLSIFFHHQDNDFQNKVLKELYQIAKNDPILLKRFISLNLYYSFKADNYKEMDLAILSFAVDPSQFEELFEAYLNHFALACFCEAESKSTEKEEYFLRPRDLEELSVLVKRLNLSPDVPGYQSPQASITTYRPSKDCKYKNDINRFILNFIQRAIHFLQMRPEVENRYLRDFIFHNLYAYIEELKDCHDQWIACFSPLIEACGNTQEMYVQHMRLCVVLHKKALETKFYKSDMSEIASYMLALKPSAPSLVTVRDTAVMFVREWPRMPKNIHLLFQHALKIIFIKNLVTDYTVQKHVYMLDRMKKLLIEYDILDKIAYSMFDVFEAVLPPMAENFKGHYMAAVLKFADNICISLVEKYPAWCLTINLAFYKAAIRNGYLSSAKGSNTFEVIRIVQKQIEDIICSIAEKEEYSRVRSIILEVLDASSTPEAMQLKIEFLEKL